MLSAKDRIISFWEQFSQNREKIESLLDEKKQKEALGIVSGIFASLDLPQQLLIGKAKKRYELTFSPAGDSVIKLLSRAWKELAPAELSDKWDFYAFKQGMSRNFEIFMGKKFYPVNKFTYACEQNGNGMDVEIYSRAFKKLTEDERKKVSTIALDHAFGEEFVEQRFKTVTPVTKKSDMEKQKCSFRKLKKLVKESKKTPLSDPYDVWSAFRFNGEPQNGIRRDFRTYISSVPALVTDTAKISADASEYGARFCGFALEAGDRTQQEMLAQREEFASKLGSFLKERNLGYVVAAATGTAHTYIDAFILNDGELAVLLSDIKGFLPENGQLYFI